jgi:hypothetical protein
VFAYAWSALGGKDGSGGVYFHNHAIVEESFIQGREKLFMQAKRKRPTVNK